MEIEKLISTESEWITGILVVTSNGCRISVKYQTTKSGVIANTTGVGTNNLCSD